MTAKQAGISWALTPMATDHHSENVISDRRRSLMKVVVDCSLYLCPD